MDICKFNALSEKQKAYAVWDGVHISSRLDHDLAIKLYSVHSFFVEAFYCTDENKILAFIAFKAKAMPDVYIEQFELQLT